MNRRTLLLALAAAAIGGLYVLDVAYRSWIEEPTGRLEGQLAAAEKELSDLQAEQVASRRLTGRLDDYAARALPYDPELARSHYREWLLGLIERFEMKSASVNAESPREVQMRGRIDRRQRRAIGHTIRYTARGRTTLDRFVDFLHAFERSAQLHKMLNFTLSPLGNGSELDVTMSIEALSLQATDREEMLSDWVRTEDSMPGRERLTELVRRNVFARGFSQSLAGVRLQAITKNREGTREAWFATGNSKETQIVAGGETLELPLHSVEVEQVEADRARIRVQGMPVWLDLGKTVGQIFDPTGMSGADEETEPTPEAEPG